MSADHILIVDDSDSIRFLLARTFEAKGYVVSLAADAWEAADLAAHRPPDAVILDEELPGRRGSELLRAWRAEGVEVPVIVVSSATRAEVRRQALAVGASDFVAKPFSPLELVARVRECLDMPMPAA